MKPSSQGNDPPGKPGRFTHTSQEAAHHTQLDHLGLDPLLDLHLRLGEASGAALALPLIEAAARILTDMNTFEHAGVSQAG